MYLLIYEAIEKKHLLQFCYDGTFRIAEPHLYGSDRSGTDLLCAYQIAGSDAFGRHNGWQKFEVGKISELTCLPTTYPAPRAP